MYKIGYRIKLPKDEKMQELFLSRYSTLFNTFELKITHFIYLRMLSIVMRHIQRLVNFLCYYRD